MLFDTTYLKLVGSGAKPQPKNDFDLFEDQRNNFLGNIFRVLAIFLVFLLKSVGGGQGSRVPPSPWAPMIFKLEGTGPLGPPLSDAPDLHIYTVLFLNNIEAYLLYIVQSYSNILSNEFHK